MKIEVVVDKDNTHFSYMHECDAVKDGEGYGKLVLLRKLPRPKNATEEELKAYSHNPFETVAVYAVWTRWVKLPDNAEKCERCGRYRILNNNGYCTECVKHYEYEDSQKE